MMMTPALERARHAMSHGPSVGTEGERQDILTAAFTEVHNEALEMAATVCDAKRAELEAVRELYAAFVCAVLAARIRMEKQP